jgi:predicted membrane channel-forming protein YqfA (hemolysin III family)
MDEVGRSELRGYTTQSHVGLASRTDYATSNVYVSGSYVPFTFLYIKHPRSLGNSDCLNRKE